MNRLPRPKSRGKNVFINCPFDDEYKPLFDAIVFTVQIAGFRPRCALEASNAGEVRLEKIMNIIFEGEYGIHDISRTQLDEQTSLPRFNMPLELGLNLGSRRYGVGKQRAKKLMVMDRSRHRYQKFISDIAGQDITPHYNSRRQSCVMCATGSHLSPGAKTCPEVHMFIADIELVRESCHCCAAARNSGSIRRN